METPEERRHDYDPAPEAETPEGAADHESGGAGHDEGAAKPGGDDAPEGLDSQKGDAAGGDADGTERVPEADQE